MRVPVCVNWGERICVSPSLVDAWCREHKIFYAKGNLPFSWALYWYTHISDKCCQGKRKKAKFLDVEYAWTKNVFLPVSPCAFATWPRSVEAVLTGGWSQYGHCTQSLAGLLAVVAIGLWSEQYVCFNWVIESHICLVTLWHNDNLPVSLPANSIIMGCVSTSK